MGKNFNRNNLKHYASIHKLNSYQKLTFRAVLIGRDIKWSGTLLHLNPWANRRRRGGEEGGGLQSTQMGKVAFIWAALHTNIVD